VTYKPIFPKAYHKKAKSRSLASKDKKFKKLLDEIFEENWEIFLELGRL
jgi:hypothetical protein